MSCQDGHGSRHRRRRSSRCDRPWLFEWHSFRGWGRRLNYGRGSICARCGFVRQRSSDRWLSRWWKRGRYFGRRWRRWRFCAAAGGSSLWRRERRVSRRLSGRNCRRLGRRSGRGKYLLADRTADLFAEERWIGEVSLGLAMRTLHQDGQRHERTFGSGSVDEWQGGGRSRLVMLSASAAGYQFLIDTAFGWFQQSSERMFSSSRTGPCCSHTPRPLSCAWPSSAT